VKKFIVLSLTLLALVASASVASAADTTGKIGILYTPLTVSDEVNPKDSNTANSFGVTGEVSFAEKFGAALSYTTGKTKDDVNKDASNCTVSVLNVDGTYTLVNTKEYGKIDLTLGYNNFKFDPEVGTENTYSGVAVGVKGTYDAGSNITLDYKLSYAPSLTISDNMKDFYKSGTAFGYKIGIDYPVQNNFSVIAGYAGNNLSLKDKTDDQNKKASVSGFYLGASMKF